MKITKGLANITKASGEAVKLRCEATGEPPPTKFEWLKNEAPVSEEKNRLVVRRYNVKVSRTQLVFKFACVYFQLIV